MAASKLRIHDGDTPSPTTPPPRLDHDPPRNTGLSDRARTLLWALTYWAWNDQPDCWPGNAALKRHLGWSTRKLQYAIADAVSAGYLARRMERTSTGSRRVFTITSRVKSLAIFNPGPEGGGGATSCTTPVQDVAPPPVQDVAPEVFLHPEREEKENPPAVRPPQERRPSGWLIPVEEAPEENLLSPSDLAQWHEWKKSPGCEAVRKLATVAIARHERAEAILAARKDSRPGLSAKNPRPAADTTILD